jgi:ubiquinone/menaquinone biosynthesis C-methylase UbiE
VKDHWNSFAPIYSLFDATMQTFYYTLVNVLDIKSANHILEIASGIGRMIPYSVSLKKPECTYLASDISETMIDLSKKYLQEYLTNLGVSEKA